MIFLVSAGAGARIGQLLSQEADDGRPFFSSLRLNRIEKKIERVFWRERERRGDGSGRHGNAYTRTRKTKIA